MFAGPPFSAEVSPDVKTFVGEPEPAVLRHQLRASRRRAGSRTDRGTSLALVPLTTGAPAQPFGLLVLGSPDPTRYTAEMGTEFLARVGEIASAAPVAPAADALTRR